MTTQTLSKHTPRYYVMASREDVYLRLLITVLFFVSFLVKKSCFRQPDGISITLKEEDLYHDKESYCFSSLFNKTPRLRSSRKNVCLLILLICGDIETNPGPIRNISCLKDLCSKRGLKLLHQNVRGIQGKFDEIKILLQQNKFDIFGMTELFTNKIIPSSTFNIPGFTFLRVDRRNGQGKGVGMYIRNEIYSTRRTDLEDDEYESIWIETRPKNSKPIIFGIIYKPPDTSLHLSEDFNKILSTNLEAIEKENKETIIMGDLNTDYLKENDHRDIKDIFTKNGYKQILKTPTRVTPTTATLIEVIQTNNPQNISYHAVIPYGLSDHDLTACVRKMNNIKYEPITIRCRDLKNYDEREINKDLLDAHWESIYNTDSPNKAWFAMHSILKGTIDRHAPFISKCIKGKPSPWITDKLKKEMNARDKLMRKARKTKN